MGVEILNLSKRPGLKLFKINRLTLGILCSGGT